MKAAQFEYNRAQSLGAARDLLQGSDGSIKIMAGSQSLGPMLNMRLTRPTAIIDISALAELNTVTASSSGIDIGAGVSHAQIEDGVHAALRGHPMKAVAGQIAYRAVRNRGTVGGSLAHADPAADWIVVMTALGAELTLVSARKTRRVPMSQFMQGAYTTVLQANEMITTIHLPVLAADVHWGYYKFCRKPGAFADASAAVLLEPSTRTARIFLGALDGPPRELAELAATIASTGAANRGVIVDAVSAATGSAPAVQTRLRAVVVERALAQAGIAPAVTP